MSPIVEITSQLIKTSKLIPFVAVGIILLYIAGVLQLDPIVRLTTAVVGLVLILTSSGVELFTYLQQGLLRPTFPVEAFQEALSKLLIVENQITDLKGEQEGWAAQLSTRIFSPSEKEELKQAVIERLHQHEMKAALIEVEEKIRREQKRAAVAGLRSLYEGLKREILNLGRRANLNLVMGTGVTVLGLSLLAYFVFYATHPSSSEKLDIAIYFGTRLTLVVFIEVFAYFFLRLYRYSIFEIKYFQNELTNARFKIVGLEVCLHDGTKQTVDKICMELAKTERNFILKNGETTLSLRRDELEQLTDSTMAKLIERILKRPEPKKETDNK
jgi:hypothetical protein